MMWKFTILHFKFMKWMWTWLLQQVFSQNHHTTYRPCARPLGNIRDLPTTLGEIPPTWHPPWTPPDWQCLSFVSICGLFTTRLMGWLSPHSLHMSGCSVRALIHETWFLPPTPIDPDENIWGSSIFHPEEPIVRPRAAWPPAFTSTGHLWCPHCKDHWPSPQPPLKGCFEPRCLGQKTLPMSALCDAHHGPCNLEYSLHLSCVLPGGLPR